ncbi:MAG TPA: metallophosphoesterase, partial [Edaphobacter sp.]|nr:metallophosphoesterase [Edaphobacter sp.]
MNELLSRRRFLRQSFAFSALAGLGAMPSFAKGHTHQNGSLNWLMIGDWGSDRPAGQEAVAEGMLTYAKQH